MKSFFYLLFLSLKNFFPLTDNLKKFSRSLYYIKSSSRIIFQFMRCCMCLKTKYYPKVFPFFAVDNKLSFRVSSKLFLPTFTQFFWFKYEQKQSSEAFSCVCEIDKNSEHESIFHDWKIFVSNFPEIWFAEEFFSVFILVFRKLFVTNNEFLWFLPSFIRIRRCGKLFEATTFIFSQLFLLLFFIYLISFSLFFFWVNKIMNIEQFSCTWHKYSGL